MNLPFARAAYPSGHIQIVAMPRYFFHVCNGNGFVEDEEGMELPDVQTAHAHAVAGLRDILASELRKAS